MRWQKLTAQVIIKLSGCALTVLSSVLWGQKKIRAERRKTAELGSLVSLVGFIGANISHFCRPLPEIYADFSDELLDSSGFTGLLRENGLKAALEGSSLSLDKNVMDGLTKFAARLGGDYRDEQIELCEYERKRLLSALKERKTAAHDKEKLYRTCPVLLALSAVLMFI